MKSNFPLFVGFKHTNSIQEVQRIFKRKFEPCRAERLYFFLFFVVLFVFVVRAEETALAEKRLGTVLAIVRTVFRSPLWVEFVRLLFRQAKPRAIRLLALQSLQIEQTH